MHDFVHIVHTVCACGAILLDIELAPSMEDEDKDVLCAL